MRDDPEVQRAVSAYQLGLPKMPVAGRSGDLLGRGTGSSIEFQEYREYMPGDDIRHLDWSAYARSDSLMVRLYREEISPRTEILLDGSRSMSLGGEAKQQEARRLTALFALLSGHLGGRPDVVVVDDGRPLRSIHIDGLDALDQLPFSATRSLADALGQRAVAFKKQAVRIVISDFLFPHDPQPLIRRLAAESSVLWVVQILHAWEADPTPMGGRRLVDVETGGEADLVIDRRAISAYKERLGQLQQELARNCRRVGALFATLVADRGLATLCRDDLCKVGMLRPV